MEEDHRKQMEEGGFIMVLPETQHGSGKGRGTDGVNTVQGVSQEEAKEYLDKQRRKLEGKGEDEDDEGVKYTSNKVKRSLMTNDFYKFQIKEVKKQQLDELRKGFEEDRRRLAKLLEKRQAKEKKAKETETV